MRISVLAAVAITAGLFAAPSMAQAPSDLTKFSEACNAGQTFLIGQVPEGFDASTIMTPLCGCLATAFKDMSQKDVDMLAADLRGEGTEEAHKAHGDYAGLSKRARDGLSTCFAAPDVAAALEAAQPKAPAEPAPAVPAPAAPATPQ